jgi:hypothetical protein
VTLYEFERSDGAKVEADFPFGKAPPIGELVALEGHGPCRRVVSWQSTEPAKDVHFVSWQLPQWYPDAPAYDRDPKSASYGQPRFTSRRELDEFLARHPELAYGAMPATCERTPRCQKAHAMSKIPTVVIEGPPPGRAHRRRRKGPRKGRA